MKINVALFITALSTTATSRHGVLPVVSAAAAGDDGAAAAVDRPHLRALQEPKPIAVCPAAILAMDNSDAYNPCTSDYCNGCDYSSSTNQFTNCIVNEDFETSGGGVTYAKACCTTSNNMNNCYDPNNVLATAQEDSMFIKADEDEEEEMPPQDTTTTDKLGDEIEARSSTLRASSLLKDNVFTKQDGDFLEVATCSPVSDAPSDPCTATTEDYYLNCSGCSGKTNCVSSPPSSSGGAGSNNQWSAKCCNNGGQCNDASTQADASLLKVE